MKGNNLFQSSTLPVKLWLEKSFLSIRKFDIYHVAIWFNENQLFLFDLVPFTVCESVWVVIN